MAQQIVIHKGWQGFADRVTALAFCIKYCKINNAALCVDWRDPLWGQDTEDFHDYFEIHGVPVVSLNEVVERVRAGASIASSAWTLEHIKKPNTFATFMSDDFLNVLKVNFAKVQADVVVSSTRGFRSWGFDTLKDHIRFRPDVAEILISRLKALKSPYMSVHLRGTDRIEREAIDKARAICKQYPEEAGERMYVVSDMMSMVNTWSKHYPQSVKLEESPEILKLPNDGMTDGTHYMVKEVLEYYGLSKRNLNLNTLTDFCTIAYANWRVGHATSAFSHVASGLGGGISQWLGGFYPSHYSAF